MGPLFTPILGGFEPFSEVKKKGQKKPARSDPHILLIGPLLSQRFPLASAKAQPRGGGIY